jgi:hypothetical protein
MDDPMTPGRFDTLLERLKACDSAAAFDCLFTVALAPKRYGHDQWASRMLVELDPPCPLPLDRLLTAYPGKIDLSNRLVPFYLSGQFGKAAVAHAVRRMPVMSCGALAGIGYWLGFPLADLILPYLWWVREWRKKA